MTASSPRRSWLQRLATMLRTPFHRVSERDLDDEIAAYVADRTATHVQAGVPPAEARRRALAEAGIEQVKEETRDVYPWHALQMCWRDVQYGARSLRRSPGFAVVVTATVALCVGASVTVFTIMHAVMWRELPYPNSDRLVSINAAFGTVTDSGLAPGEVRALRTAVQAIDQVGVVNAAEAFITVDDQMDRVSSASASVEVLPLLGAMPMRLGRMLDADIDFGDGPVRGVVISHRLWHRMFHGDPDVVGRRTRVNDLDVEVLGVLPETFRSWLPASTGVRENTDVWFPGETEDGWQHRSVGVIARLSPGVTIDRARPEIDALAARLRTEHASHYQDAIGPLEFQVQPLRDVVGAPAARGLVPLGISVAFVLVIGCVNVANLMLARALSREREFATRVALGAGRFQVWRQRLAEQCVLAAAGGAAALAVVSLGLAFLNRFGSGHLPRQSTIALGVDTALMTCALAAAMVVVCGALAAWRPRSDRAPGSLLSIRSSTSSTGGRRLQRALVVAEVALSVAPLFGAGLMIRTFMNLSASPLGFDATNVVTAKIGVSLRRFPDPAARWVLYQNAMDAVAALPGVEAISGASPLPFEPPAVLRFRRNDDDASGVIATRQSVLPGYLNVVRASLVAGRDFTGADIATRQDVAIVDEAFARLLWPGNPLGQRFDSGSGRQQRSLEVVGVIRRVQVTRVLDAQRTAVRDEALPHVLVPYHVSPVPMTLMVRTSSDEAAAAIGPAIERAVEGLGVTRAVYDVQPLSAYVANSIREPRFSMLVLAVFAATSLVLAIVGLYGTLAYLVSLRTREFALRLALGASARQIVGLVAGEGLLLTTIGAVAGIAGAIAVGRVLAGLLYGVAAIDTTTLAAVGLTLAGAAMLSVLHPAWRAARVDPRITLQAD